MQTIIQFVTPRTVRLSHLNIRDEKHGPESVSALDADLVIEGGNSILALLHAGLKDALFYRSDDTEDQGTIESVEEIAPDLRFPKMASTIKWDLEQTGMDVKVVFGTADERSNIHLSDCKVKVKSFSVSEGGSCAITMQASTSNIPDGALDKLRRLLNRQIDITLVQNEQLRAQAVIDGTVGHPGAAQDGPDDADDEGSDPDVDPVLEAMKAAPRTARGRAKTQAALQEGAES